MRVVIYISSLFFFFNNCSAQTFLTDTTNISNTQKETIAFFNTAVGVQSEIFNGAVYTLYPSAAKGTFYFQDRNSVIPSQIIYNGILYKNVPVIYDVYHDQMVSFADGELFVLVPENLTDVYLDGHHFVNAAVNDAPGYYEELYDGRSQILLKRTKVVEEHIVPPQTAENWYLDKKQLFIRMNNHYVTVTGKAALLKAFGTRRKEVEHYLSDSKLDFTTDPETTAAKAAAFYDQLNP